MPEHSRRRPRTRHFVASGAALVIVAAGAFIAVNRASGKVSAGQQGAATTRPVIPTPASTTTTTPPPLTVASVLPANGATKVAYASTVTVQFSEPLAATSPPPRLAPAVAGSWARVGPATFTFTPSSPFVPGSRIQVVVPTGADSVVGAAGQQLVVPYRSTFTVAPGSVLRLQQLLAQLDYLPLSFSQPLTADATTAGAVALAPQAGTFSWRFPNIPAQLSALWTPGTANVITSAAVMSFESDHNLGVDGDAGPLVWNALLKAVAARQATARPYDYLITTETLPETLYVWRDGTIIYQSAANSGAAGAATPLGTWPVYLRYTATTMSGTNPDGSHYRDPGVPWVSYFYRSDAVHGFVRSRYGFPQSDGCIELPVAHAATVFPDDPIGTLVTVTAGNLTSELAPAGATPPAYS